MPDGSASGPASGRSSGRSPPPQAAEPEGSVAVAAAAPGPPHPPGQGVQEVLLPEPERGEVPLAGPELAVVGGPAGEHAHHARHPGPRARPRRAYVAVTADSKRRWCAG